MKHTSADMQALLMDARKILLASDTDISFETTIPERVPAPTKEGECVDTDDDVTCVVNVDDIATKDSNNISVTINGDDYQEYQHKEHDYNMRYAIDNVLAGQELQYLQHYTSAQRVGYVKSKALCAAMTAVEALCLEQVRNRTVGTESYLTAFIPNVITSLLDCGTHLLNIFKMVILRGFADFKRTELHAFLDNHVLMWQRVRLANYTKLSPLALPIPATIECTNLKTPYLQVIDFLSQVGIRDRVSVLVGIAKSLKNSKSVPVPTGDEESVLRNSKQLTAIYKTNSHKDKDTFGNLYGSVRDFMETIDTIRDGEHFFFEVTQVHSAIENFDKHMSKVELNKIDAATAATLAHKVRVIGELLTAYGTSITMLDTLDHHAAMHADLVFRKIRDGEA